MRGNQIAGPVFVTHVVGYFEDGGDTDGDRREAAEGLDRHRRHATTEQMSPSRRRVDDDAYGFLARHVRPRDGHRVRASTHRHVRQSEPGHGDLHDDPVVERRRSRL